MSKTRTFIAVPASLTTREGAAKLTRELRPLAADAKWVAPANLHWTLQFLGDVEVTILATVCDRMAEAAAAVDAFVLEARGAGAFPSLERPRTLWLGASGGSTEMQALQRAIETVLADLGFHGENRRFVPHLTLGRAGRSRNTRQLAAALANFADFEAGGGIVDEVIAYGSELGREGPTYHVIGRAPLGG